MGGKRKIEGRALGRDIGAIIGKSPAPSAPRPSAPSRASEAAMGRTPAPPRVENVAPTRQGAAAAPAPSEAETGLVTRVENGLAEAVGYNAQAVSQGEAVSSTDTFQKNIRWYLVTNFRQALSHAYTEIGLVQTLVDVPVDDALRGGVIVKSKQLNEEQIEDLVASLDRDDDITLVGQAAKWTRLFGGAAVLVLTDQDPTTPLDVDAITEETPLEFRAVDLWELHWSKMQLADDDKGVQLDDLDDDADDCFDYYGEKVHKSRVLKMTGITAPSFVRPRMRGWGVSVVETLVRSINQYLKATALGFEVLDEFKLDIYKIKGLTNSLMTVGGQEKVAKRVQLANWQKDYQTAVVMDSEDEYDHKQLSFAGLAEAMSGIRSQVASDVRMPQTRLFGQSAAGFSSGEDDIEVYNGMVEGQVRGRLKKPLLRVIELRCQKLFGFVPDDLTLAFKPLRVLSAVDEENVKTQKFNRLLQAKERGEITVKEFRDACNKGGLFDVSLDTDDALMDELEGDQADDGAELDDVESEDGEGDGEADTPPKKLAIANDAGKFDEGKHPRADDGKFGSGGAATGKKPEAPPKGAEKDGGVDKKRRAGKLPAGDAWTVQSSIHARDGERGEDGYSCAHCNKPIKRLVTMSHPEHDGVIVGEDCAEALVEGSAKTRLEKFYAEKKAKEKSEKTARKEEIKEDTDFAMRPWRTNNPRDKPENARYQKDALEAAARYSETGTLLSPRVDVGALEPKEREKIVAEAFRMQAAGERGSAFQHDALVPKGAALNGATAEWTTWLVPALDAYAAKAARKKNDGETRVLTQAELHALLLARINRDIAERETKKPTALERVIKNVLKLGKAKSA